MATLILLNAPVMAEHIFLKDGSIIEGKIENETLESIIFIKNDGTKQKYNLNNIIRFVYKELYMGKLYVQKTDGKGLELYMVDENKEFYIFRFEINKPEEIKIKRTEVLFISRMNPLNLQAIKVDTDRIDLIWLPPYNKVNKFKVYYKNSLIEKFKLAGDTSFKKISITNLKSNTQYFFIVTAVDSNNYESLPSNEIKETTKNIRPNPPKNIKLEKIWSPDKKNFEMIVKWDPAIDPDGQIIEYIIYKRENKAEEIFARTNNTAYSIKSLNPLSKKTFFIRAVDNMEDESENSSSLKTKNLFIWDIGVRAFAIFPNLPYGYFYNTGWGLLADFLISDLFLEGFGFGLEIGYFQLPGRAEYPHILRNNLVPVMLALQYRIGILKWLYIDTRLSGGYLYNSIDYDLYQISTSYSSSDSRFITRFSNCGIMIAGIGIGFNTSDLFSLSIGGDYGIIFRNSGAHDFFSLNLSVIFRINI